MGEILRATEGKLAPTICLELGPELCERQNDCPARGFWTEFYQTINQFLDSKTLRDLMPLEES